MARLDIRISDEEKSQLRIDAFHERKTLSALVRERLFGVPSDSSDRVESLERRVARLEEMAGL